MVKTREITYNIYVRFVREEKYTAQEIKEWVNEQRESGKKRTFEGNKFQFNNLELVEQDYKKKKANGGHTSDTWMYSAKHLYAESKVFTDDPDEWSTGDYSTPRFHLIFPNHTIDMVDYGVANRGKLLPWHEVKACNGIVWKHDEAFLTENADKCEYVGPREYIECGNEVLSSTSDYAIPTRGNCKECGANGPLLKECINMCAYIPRKDMIRDKEIIEEYPFLKKWMVDHKDEYKRSRYQMMLTPDYGGIVDAEFFSLACAKQPETDVEQHVMSFLKQKHKIRARVGCYNTRRIIPERYEDFVKNQRNGFRLKENDIMWKKVVKLCEDKGYGHPSNLNNDAVHIPDWDTYGLPFNQDGMTTSQECVGSSETVNQDNESREPSDDLERGS